MTNTDSAQFAAQIGHMFGLALLKGVWMALVMMGSIFVAAWPAFLLLGAMALVSYKLR